MNFGTLGTGFGGLGRGGAGVGASELFQRIQAGRVDFLGIGDSNQGLAGFGWDHGFQYALAQQFPMYATGIISLNENNSDGAGIGYTYAYNGSAPLIGATTGADAFADAYLAAGAGSIYPHAYGYLDDAGTVSNSTASGFTIAADSPIAAQDQLTVHYLYATFASGTGNFGVCLRRESSPFTIYGATSFTTAPLTDAVVRGSFTVAASAARAGLPLGVKWTNVGTLGINGPFCGFWSRVERTAQSTGFSYHTLGYYGGSSLKDMAYYLQEMSDTTLDNFLQEAIALQGAAHTVVICINSGLNDRNEADTSVGPAAVTDGDSAEAYVDNLTAVRQRIEARWSAIGEDLEDLFWIILPSHRISDPDDAELISYRLASETYSSTWPRAYFVDFNTLMTAAEAISNSWYASSGSDPTHLTQAGYEAISVRVMNQVSSAVTYEGYPFTDSDAIALASVMDPAPTYDEGEDIETLILALKAAGTWSKRDYIQIYASHSQQAALLNWKTATTMASLVGTPAPVFTINQDFTTDGSQNEIDTGFNPATAGGLFGQDSANFSIWSRTSGQISGSVAGWFDGSDGVTILTRNTSNVYSARINQASPNTIGGQTDGSGYFAANRSGASATQLRRNGVEVATGSNASTALNNAPLKIGRSATATYIAFSCAACLAGGSLTGTEMADEYTAMLAYMQARGAA